jgi:hypothetical protein
MRSRICRILKGCGKASTTRKLIGCELTELRERLESQFKPGMTWDNHGAFGWHIDHIIPCSSFDMSDHEQQRQCFHYSNLQPLWWHENLAKSGNLAAMLLGKGNSQPSEMAGLVR